jgi:hypothetical protein
LDGFFRRRRVSRVLRIARRPRIRQPRFRQHTHPRVPFLRRGYRELDRGVLGEEFGSEIVKQKCQSRMGNQSSGECGIGLQGLVLGFVRLYVQLFRQLCDVLLLQLVFL